MTGQHFLLRTDDYRRSITLLDGGAATDGFRWAQDDDVLVLENSEERIEFSRQETNELWVGPNREVLMPQAEKRVIASSIASSVLQPPRPEKKTRGGAGTELTKLLHRLGFIYHRECRCKERARKMDNNGIEWCEQNVEVIIGWLEEEAQKRKVPFSHTVAWGLVVYAIRKAKKAKPNVPDLIPSDPLEQQTIVLNSNKHGYGDAAVMAWASEGSRSCNPRLVHHATGNKKVFLELLGQEVVDRQPVMHDTFRAYSSELRLKGNPPRLWQRTRSLGIKANPKRPLHTLTVEEIEYGRSCVGDDSILLWPNTDYGSREWPPMYWIRLAEMLTCAGHPVWFCGGKQDARYKAWPGIWEQSWRVNAACMLAARLVVGNDSGPAHLAGTLDVPTIALLGPTNSSVFVQYPSVTCLSASPNDIGCVGCYFHAPFCKTCEVGCVALGHVLPETVFDTAVETFK